MNLVSDLPSIPGFRVERLLGRGAYGRVYLAREVDGLERPVALKVFSDEAPQAFAKELEVLKRVEELRRQGRHAGIVQAFGSGEHGGRGWIALEYLEAGSLRERVEREGPLPWPEALACVTQAAEATRVLHEAGLFHRDIKPSNLLLGADGRVRLGDFGLTRDLDASLSAAGSPAFAPPEVIAGKVGPSQRARVDVYGLGATLSFLVTGETARPGRPDAFQLERAGVPRAAVELLLEAMAYEPEERPADAGALLLRLQALGENSRASPPTPEGEGEERERMKKAVVNTPAPIRTDLEIGVERPRCPFCHEAVSSEEAKSACQECMAWHHAACWAEGERCSACGSEAGHAQGRARPSRRRRLKAALVGLIVAVLLGWVVGVARDINARERARLKGAEREAELGAQLQAEQEAAARARAEREALEEVVAMQKAMEQERLAAEAAGVEVTQVRQLTGDVREVFQRAKAAHEEGRHDEALKDYRWVTTVHPRVAEVFYLMGHIYLLREDHHFAVIQYDEAIRLEPDYAEAYYQRANAREGQGDFHYAVQDNLRALECLPADDSRREAIEENLARCRAKLEAKRTPGR